MLAVPDGTAELGDLELRLESAGRPASPEG
jgi:hypothetical protein